MHRLSTILLLITIVSFGSRPVSASPTGSITGFVKDPSCAHVSAVQLTLLRKDTNTRWTTTTDINGSYQFPQLPPATYSLAAESKGFKKVNFATVVVQVDLVTRVDIQFEIGEVTEVVEVAAAAPIL